MLDLTPFSNGSDKFYAYTLGTTRVGVFTDGVKYVADKCGAYWLIDVIMSYQTKEFKEKNPFQVWILTSDGCEGAKAVCEDGNENHVLSQNIEYSDFPFDEVKNGKMAMWFADDTLLLPCEY